MPEPIRIKAALVKEETTYGTDPTPSAGSDEVRVEENFWNSLTITHREDNLREQSVATFGRTGSEESTQAVAELELVVALKGRSSAFSASNTPMVGRLLKACGYGETVDTTSGSETVTYTPDSSSLSSVTIYAYSANKEFQVTGVIGNVVLDFTPGQVARARFSLQGLIDPTTDISETGLPGSLDFQDKSIAAPVVQSGGFTLNSQDPDDFYSLEIDTQVQVAERPGGNAARAHAGFWYADFNPMLTAEYEVFALGTQDPWAARANGTRWSGDLGTIGSTQYNQIDVSWSNLRITDLPPSDQEGLATINMSGRLENSDATTEDPFDLQFS